eukprot:12184628-Alexandrium_andersonii.AAC.1
MRSPLTAPRALLAAPDPAPPALSPSAFRRVVATWVRAAFVASLGEAAAPSLVGDTHKGWACAGPGWGPATLAE